MSSTAPGDRADAAGRAEVGEPGDDGPRVRAVLFDLDGTLLDSIPALRRGYARFLAGHGREGSDAEFARFAGPPLPVVIEGLRAAHELAGDAAGLLAEYVAAVEAEYLTAPLAPGAFRLLDTLASAGVACAVVTSAPARLCRAVLAARGVTERLRVIVCGDEVPRGKPAPDGYLAGLAALCVPAARALAVEDTRTGVRAARAAGLRCLGIVPEERRLPMARAGALVSAASLDEIGAIVAALQQGPGRRLSARALSVRLVPPLPPLDEASERSADEAFRAARAANPTLHDGRLLSVVSLRAEQDAITVEVAEIPYRHYVAQRAGVALGVRPLGVTGATFLEPSGALAAGRRGDEVTAHGGCWELLPSGGLTPAFVHSDGTVDAMAQLLQELHEEVGLDPSRVTRVTPLGVIEDLEGGILDLAFRIDVRAEPDELLAGMRASGEYRALGLCRRDVDGWTCDPPHLLDEDDARAPARVPTAVALRRFLDER